MNRWVLVAAAGAAILALGIASIILSVMSHPLYNNCGNLGNRYCPGTVSNSPEFMAGFASLFIGAAVALYGYMQMD